MSVPELVTIPRIPLVHAGVEYRASTGVFTPTEADLRAAVAALDDPGMRAIGVKFGHERKQPVQQPQVGRFVNVVYDEEDMTVYADLAGVPKWLADILPVAYPDRSIEGNYNFISASGKTHQFVIEDVALLGESPPAVGTLDDLYELFYGDGSYFTKGEVAAKGEPVAKPVSATVEVDDVRRVYYESLGSDQMWWWIRAIRLDPNELIVDDDEGSLYRVPFMVEGEEISFGDPQPVKIVYEDVAAVAASLGSPLAVYASRVDSRPETENNPMKEPSVDFADIAERLGLPKDASREDILAKLDAQNQTDDPPTNDPPVQDDPPVTEPTPAPSTPAVPEGMVLVDDAQWAEVQEAVAASRTMAEERKTERRTQVIDAAVKAGKFPRSRAEHYAKMHEADPDGTEQLLASMADGLIPINQRGSSASPEGTQVEAAYDPNWLTPGERAKKAAVEAGTYARPRIQFAMEG